MSATVKTVKCRNCGHEYIILSGGFIPKTSPSQCPKCGTPTRRWF